MLLRRQLLPVLANLKLAIALLLIIALASILGTVIEQGETTDFYESNYPLRPALFGFLSYKVILALGLNQVYGSWWYLCLLILFGASLIACTLHRQIPLFKVARRWFYYHKPESIRKMPISGTLEKMPIPELKTKLEKLGYQVFWDERGQLYGRKGLVGRMAPIVVHISIILILAGAIWGAWAGFSTQALIPSGTIASLSIPKREWQLRVNRFWIDYTPAGKVDQFYSDLSLLDRQNHELIHKVIHVNEPLRYRGVTFYQASWDVSALRFQLNNSPVLQLPLQKLEAKSNGAQVWGTWLPTKPDLSEGVTLITPDLQGTFLIYDKSGQLLSSVLIDQPQQVNGVNLTIRAVVGATGLQIKADPSIPLVYGGFGLLMLSVMGSYVSHSQVWALQDGDQVLVGGKTNRALLQFAQEMQGIMDQ